MTDVTRLRSNDFTSDLDEIAREGARRMLAEALEAEVADYIAGRQEKPRSHKTAVTAGLLISVSTAHAGRPLDVDCDLLAATNDAVNDFLDAEGIQFDNLGDLLASAILDDAVFDQLSALILFFSGGAIDFQSATQAISTNARCGLIPQLVDNVND